MKRFAFCSVSRRFSRRKTRGAIDPLEERNLLTSSTSVLDLGTLVASRSYDPSSIIVRFDSSAGCTVSQCARLTQQSIPEGVELTSTSSFLPQLRKVWLPDNLSVDQALAAFRARSDVLYAEPNYRMYATGIPDDSEFGDLWGLHNEGQTGGRDDADIDAPRAWDVTVGSANSVVAVIDTGVDYNHPDIAANMWTNSAEVPNDGLDNDGNGYVDDVHGYDFVNRDEDPIDDHGHGTHVAGTIAAVGNNGIGVSGVTWNAKIMALKVLDADGFGLGSDIIEALNYAVANGATISNNSYGGDPYSQAFRDGIAAAQAMDHVFVAGAGNGDEFGVGQDNDDAPFYPASYDLDNVISVAATDSNDRLAGFSNYGSTSVHLGAPGVDILSLQDGGGYVLNSGTSMAAPHVTGVVALVQGLNDGWTYQQVIGQVLNNVDPVPALQGITVTGGRLNAAAAVGNPEPTPPDPPSSALPIIDDFNDNVAEDFEARSGVWNASSNRYHGSRMVDDASVSSVSTIRAVTPLPADLDFQAIVSAAPTSDGTVGDCQLICLPIEHGNLSNAFLVFDYHGITEFKYAGLDMATDQIIIGHRTDAGWFTDAVLGQALAANAGYHVRLVIENATDVEVYVESLPRLSYSFGEDVTDGQLGLGGRNSISHFNNVLLRSQDDSLQYLDNGDVGFSTTGSWNPSSNTEGYLGDIVHSAAGNGADVASWDFAVTPGQYQVSVTWSPHTNRATDAPYTVFDDTFALVTALVDQQQSPNDFFDLGADWEDIGVFNITSNDLRVELSDEANNYVIADAVRLRRVGDVIPGPEIHVSENGEVLADNVGSSEFGNTPVGIPINKTFTVRNIGTSNLDLVEPINLPAGFSLVTSFGATTLAPGQSTTFEVALDATSAGTFSGEISFGNDDADENPFNFELSGAIVTAQIVDNGDIGFNMAGSWNPSHNEGYQDDILHSAAGSGTDVASWNFAVVPGEYQVATTWSAHSNRASDAPYTILDGNVPLVTSDLNQRIAPNDFSDVGVGWENLGSFQITANSLIVELSDQANGYVIADAIRIERTGDLGPEVEISDTSGEIIDDLGLVDFGATLVGAPISRVFTVSNVGSLNLVLAEPINLPAGFSLLNSFGATTLSPGQSTTFEAAFDAASAGTFSGEISFGNNDNDENPFNFAVSGSAVTTVILDNGDDGFSTAGSWNASSNTEGYLGGIVHSDAGTGADVASWDFAVVPGEYQVSATWSAHSNRASDAPYTILDGNVPLVTSDLNQRIAPNDFSDAGVGWENLGSFHVTANSLTVELSDQANGYVIADAIRIQRLGDLGPEVEVTDTNGEIIDGLGLVDFGPTLVGAPVSRIFTVTNVGSMDLAVAEPISLPPGFSLLSSFGASTLSPGQSTTFELALDAAFAGTFSGEISFATDDADENPFNFVVSGSAVTTLVLDNGDDGFNTAGNWNPANTEGYLGDIVHSAAGSGDDVASWSFAVVPGQYQVSATWSAHSNRASDAPYTILDGNALLNTSVLNQRITPDDFSDEGVGWENLGSFQITADLLTIELSDQANGYVIADAIRIERVGDLGPEVVVTDTSGEISDDLGLADFGLALVGAPIHKTFTVSNTGSLNLTLVEPINLPVGFSLLSSFGSSTLFPDQSTTFEVAFDVAMAGTFSGEISFGTDDADENPFNFTVTGSSATTVVLDNGDVGFSTTGNWNASSTEGYAGDIVHSAAGTGADVAHWDFTVVPGQYQVSTTWSPHSNRATNAPYTVIDGTFELATALLNQQHAPDDFFDFGADWKDIGVFNITSNELKVELSDAANNYVIADAVRVRRVGEVVPGPEIQVSVNGELIADNVGLSGFGDTLVGAPIQKTFTVRNIGTSTLDLIEPINVPAGFSVVSSFGATTLSPGQFTTFELALDAGSSGVFGGEVSFGNSDADENPFEFTVSGSSVTTLILDNGDAGFNTVGSWNPSSNTEGYLGDIVHSAAGSGANVASWNFAILPGQYQVWATWSAHSNRASDAPYTIFDGNVALTTSDVNQRITPNDLTDAGVGWENLGTFQVTANGLRVELSNDANQYVIADAIRIERVGEPTSAAAAVFSASGFQTEWRQIEQSDRLVGVSSGLISRPWQAGNPIAQRSIRDCRLIESAFAQDNRYRCSWRVADVELAFVETKEFWHAARPDFRSR